MIAACWLAPLARDGAAEATEAPQLLDVRKIWDAAGHNAFTDLTWFRGQWYCTFREAEGHIRGNGRIRVLRSKDGEHWSSAAFISETGIDLRDPKLSVTPNQRLMLLMGGSVYEGKTLKARRSRVAFSRNGTDWTRPEPVLENDDWLWRVTWEGNRAYGLAYNSTPSESSLTRPGEWTVKLVASADGVAYNIVTPLDVPGRPNEGTLRFQANGDCVALLRREGRPGSADRDAWIGLSHAPYREWAWHPAGMSIGGPDFLILPQGEMVAGGRLSTNASGPRTFLGSMDLQEIHPKLVLPSGGDCSYPGLVWEKGVLWVSYYSTHEGKTGIYLARVRWR